MSSDASEASHTTATGSLTSALKAGPWDANNRIRVVGATLGLMGAAGMLFDTFYRRATKQELNQAFDKLDVKIDREMRKLDVKIDKEMGKLDTKIDGLTTVLSSLTTALLHTNQRDKIAAETENRELHRQIAVLRGNK
jgi:hypothetical protein